MLFWLKKFIAYWLMPLPFCLTAMAVGLVLMRWPRRARLGRALLISGLGLLMLFSNKFVSKWLIRPIEARYPAMPEFAAGMPLPAELAACRFVIVLGGGNGNSPGVSANNLLSSSALSRVAEAVRILHAVPAAKLIVSGPRTATGESHATVLARAAQAYGITPDRILYIDQARDTEEESRAAQRLAQGARVALVTSAWHMPRSVALFRSAGLDPLPCPADFKSHAHDDVTFDDLLWEVSSLERSTLAIRERIGYLWIWLRGKA
jgi:uncharacterized SAM-binding protein YcdF (DUF218 family)